MSLEEAKGHGHRCWLGSGYSRGGGEEYLDSGYILKEEPKGIVNESDKRYAREKLRMMLMFLSCWL